QPLPFLLLVPAEDSGNDFSVLQPLAHIGGIDRYVVAGRGWGPGGAGMVRPPGGGGDCAPRGGRWGRGPRAGPPRAPRKRPPGTAAPKTEAGAGQLDVAGKRRIIVDREPIFARADRTRQREMAVYHHRLEHRRDVREQLPAAFLAVVDDHRAQPFVVGVVEGDLAGPFLAFEEFLVTLRQLLRRDQVGVVGGRVVVSR